MYMKTEGTKENWGCSRQNQAIYLLQTRLQTRLQTQTKIIDDGELTHESWAQPAGMA
jgi:hypothetical protein